MSHPPTYDERVLARLERQLNSALEVPDLVNWSIFNALAGQAADLRRRVERQRASCRQPVAAAISSTRSAP